MKIHFIGHILEKSGWGRAGRDLIKALSTTDAEITCSPVLLGKAGPLSKEDSLISDLIGKNIGKPDYIIQHLLPHHIQYSGAFKKNVACAMLETKNVFASDLPYYLDLVDEVWVPSLIDEIGHYTIPYPIEKPIDPPELYIKEVNHTYKFYTVCEYSRRKNIWGMIRAFFRAFIDADNVSLIIKTFSSEMPPDQFKEKLENDLEMCKRNCGLYKTPEVYFVTDYFSNEEIKSLHKYCDCFISSSFGESWCYPLVDALSFNNQIISSPTDGPVYLSNIGADINFVESVKTPYHGETDRLNGYHTLYEDCMTIDEIRLSNIMLAIYYKKDIVIDNSGVIDKLSFKNVGRLMCERLQA